MILDRYSSIFDLEEGKLPTVEQFEEMRRHQHHVERFFDMICMEAGMPPGMIRRRLRHREAPPTKKE